MFAERKTPRTSNLQVELLIKHKVVRLEVTVRAVAVMHALDASHKLAVKLKLTIMFGQCQKVTGSSSKYEPEKVLHFLFSELFSSSGAVQQVGHDIFARAVLAHDVGADTASVVFADGDDAHDVQLI
jgi:hypothetical protein